MGEIVRAPTRLRFTSRELAALRPALDQRFAYLPDQELWTALDAHLRSTMASEDVESFWNQVGNVLSGAASGAVPGAAMGAAAGPYGALIGAGLGAVTGGISAATRQPAARPSRAAPGSARPVAPAPAVPAAPASTPPAVPAGSSVSGVAPVPQPQPSEPAPATVVATSPALPATSALLDPQLLATLAQALVPVLLQQLGRRDGVPIGRRKLAVSAFSALDALRTLVDHARTEAESVLGRDAGHASYLRNPLGDFLGEPGSAEVRAARVLELVDEERELYAPEPIAPDIVTPLPGSPSSVTRFRRGVSNTRVFPHSAICQLRMQMSEGGNDWFIGTGFYVADGLILTAGHNVLHARYGRATRMIVTPGRRSMLVRPFGSFELGSGQMHTHARWSRAATRADFDLAVLTVRTPPPQGRCFALAEERLTSSQLLTVCGYAASEDDGVDPNEQNLDQDFVRSRTAQSMTYGLNTTGRTSGSPAYAELEGRLCAVGVHSRTHDMHTNEGCRLTADKLQWIRGLASAVPDRVEPRTFLDPQVLHRLDEPGPLADPLALDGVDPLAALFELQQDAPQGAMDDLFYGVEA